MSGSDSPAVPEGELLPEGGPEGDPEGLDEVDRLLQEILLLPGSEQGQGLEERLRANPEQAGELRKRYGALVDMDLVSGPGGKTPASQSAADLGSMEQVGPYRILDVLGDGGMGIVYLAEQRKPVRRRVALKVIKLGMDSKQLVARFEAERQALAMMEHGSIARIYDCGLTERGQPYFAMEYVKGRPVTRYCDDNRLNIRERLDLFLQICAGVQHAHNKGVIHRDLTPNNVLVSVQDGKPRVKIIDFGLARATDHRLTEATIYTEQGRILGTPEYMSPEQAGLQDLDIDTRTDVYTLGVLLYELLSGMLPFSSEELRRAGLLESQRIIREADPKRPSTRLTTMAESATELAAQRHTDIRTLSRRLRGDLDWIVMHALEKDPTRRYDTASEFAADVRRHLNDEPVEAGPPSTLYRLRKMALKHRGLVAAVGCVFVALVAGLFAALWQADVARAHARMAEANESRASENEKRAEASEVRARAAALAEASSSALRTRPMLALVLAREALRLDETWKTRSSLQAAYHAAHEVQILTGHTDGIWCVDVSKSGRLATGAKDGTVRVWDRDGKLTHTIPRQPLPTPVRDLTFVSDSAILVACGGGAGLFGLDGSLRWSDPHRTGETIWAVYGVAAREDMFATGDSYGLIRLWSYPLDGRPPIIWSHRAADGVDEKDPQQYVNGVALNPHPERWPQAFLASASQNGTVRIWTRGGESELLGARSGPAKGVSFSPDGRYLVRAGPDVTVFDLQTGDSHSFRVPGSVWSARFSPASPWEKQKWIVVASSEPSVRVFDLRGNEMDVFLGHRGQVSDAALTPDGQRLVSASEDGSVRLWKLFRERTPVLRGHQDVVRCVTEGRDGEFVTASRDGTVRVWGGDGRVLTIRRGDPKLRVNFRWAWFSRRTGRLYACSGHAGLLWWDAQGKQRRVLAEALEIGTCFALSADETRIGVTGYPKSGVISLQDPQSNPTWFHLTPHEARLGLFHLSFSPNRAEVLATSFNAGQAQAWSTTSGEKLGFSLTMRTGVHLRSASYSRDGSRVVTASDDAYMRVWDRSDSESPILSRRHPREVLHACFAPDSDRILTTCRDGVARIFTEEGELYMELRGHRNQIWRGAWTRDGKRVLTASFDRTARVWIAELGELVRRADARLRDSPVDPAELEPYRELLGDRFDQLSRAR